MARKVICTTGTIDEALASVSMHSELVAKWQDVIDHLLSWIGAIDQFDPEDAPSSEILQSALDFSFDSQRDAMPLPTSIIPSGYGRIAFEWNSGTITEIIEFVGKGQAEVSRFSNGKAIWRGIISRDPITRVSELSSSAD